MVLLRLQFVVSFSSQDTIHTADNILRNSTGSSISNKKWLCSSCDRSGKLEGEFQLEQVSLINFIDVGNFGSATVEVQVGRSSWPRNRDYVTILPAVTLMTLADAKAGVNKTSVRMFTEEYLNKEAINQKWDRVRVICCQPYVKNAQFGLSFLRLGNKEDKVLEKHALVPATSKAPKNDTNCNSTLSKKHVPLISKESLSFSDQVKLGAEVSLEPYIKLPNISPKNHNSRKNLSSYLTARCNGSSPKAPRHVSRMSAIKEDSTFEQEVAKFLSLQNYSPLETEPEVLLSAMEKWRHKSLNEEERGVFIDTLLQIYGNSKKQLKRAQVLSPSKKRPRNISGLNEQETSSRLPCVSTAAAYNHCFIQNANIPSTVNTKSSQIESGEHLQLPMPVFDLAYSGDEFDFITVKPLSSLSAFSVLPHHEKTAESSVLSDTESECVPPDSTAHKPNITSSEYEQFNMSFLECPICSDLFPSNSIEHHASDCGIRPREHPDSSAVITGQTSQMTGDVLTECPICGNFFDASSIASHADQCADQQMS